MHSYYTQTQLHTVRTAYIPLVQAGQSTRKNASGRWLAASGGQGSKGCWDHVLRRKRWDADHYKCVEVEV